MYFSLDSIDITATRPGGGPIAVQTDARSTAEIAADPALSTLIALIRCLGPRRGDHGDVVYCGVSDAPAFLKDAIAIGGARYVDSADMASMMAPWDPPAIDEAAVNALLNDASRQLAEARVTAVEAASAIAWLGPLEDRFTVEGRPAEDDPEAFWRAVLDLGVLAGEALRAAVGASWYYDATGPGTLPIKIRCPFNGEIAVVNAFGKAIKFLRPDGDFDKPSALVSLLLGNR